MLAGYHSTRLPMYWPARAVIGGRQPSICSTPSLISKPREYEPETFGNFSALSRSGSSGTLTPKHGARHEYLVVSVHFVHVVTFMKTQRLAFFLTIVNLALLAFILTQLRHTQVQDSASVLRAQAI